MHCIYTKLIQLRNACIYLYIFDRYALQSSRGQLLCRRGGGLDRLGRGGGLEGLGRRRRWRLELGDVVAERRAAVGDLRHPRLVLVDLDEDGGGPSDGDEDEPRRDGGRVLGPLRRRARRAGADGALRHVHHRLRAQVFAEAMLSYQIILSERLSFSICSRG